MDLSIPTLQPWEPKNVRQIAQRKYDKKKKGDKETTSCIGDLETLLAKQRDPHCPVRTVLVFKDVYVAFMYSEKQLRDLEMFCCNPSDNEKCVLGVDTTFKLCNMWVTDTSYRNRRLVSTRSGDHPVHLGPVMFHFSKDEETFRRFCLELVAANPALLNI